MAGRLEGGSKAGRRGYEEDGGEEDNPAKRYRPSSKSDTEDGVKKNAEARSVLTTAQKIQMDADLLEAVSKQELELIGSLIQRGASVNSVDPKLGERPLTMICKQQRPTNQSRKLTQISIIKLLLEHGASANQKNSDGKTPLHLANSSEVVKALVGKGASIDEFCHLGIGTPLVAACRRFRTSVDVITALLEAGASVNGDPSRPQTTGPLHVASYPATKLLLQYGADVNQVDSGGQSPLFVHCGKHTGLDTIRVLLEHGASVNLKADRDRTPLHVACQQALTKTVELLLQKGASVNEADSKGETPLFFAARKQASADDIITLLVEHGASVNVRNSSGKTPLHVCRFSATILIQHGALMDALDNKRETPLFTACRRKSLHDGLLAALLQHGASVNAKNIEGDTPLHVACRLRHVDTVALLLRHGADVNGLNNKHESPLFEVTGGAGFYPEALFDKLLEAGANVHLKNADGQTMLHVACSRIETSLVKLLLQKGASVNELDNQQETPLLVALRKSLISAHELINALMDSGASVRVQTTDGVTPLHIVCQDFPYWSHDAKSRTLILVNRLVEAGALVNSVDSNNRTPLETACASRSGDRELVRCLIENGAMVNRKNEQGLTPLHIVCSTYDGVHICLTLLQHGALVNATDLQGRTPLHIACSTHSDEAVCLTLLQHGAFVNATDLQGRTPLELSRSHRPFLLHYGASHCAGLSCLDPDCRFSGQHSMISEFLDSLPLASEDLEKKIGQTNVTYHDLLRLRVSRPDFEEVLSTVTPELLKSITCKLCKPTDMFYCKRCPQLQNMIYCSYLKIKRLQRMDECSCLFSFTDLPFLPSELVCNIFSYLDFEDLAALHQILYPVQKC